MNALKRSIGAAAGGVLVAACAQLAWTGAAAAATCTWTGAGAAPNWSSPDNWDGCGAAASAIPASGDVLVFPGGAAGAGTSQNDIAGLTLGAIQILGTTSGGAAYAIGGGDIALGGRSLLFSTAAGTAGAGPSVETPILLATALTVANGGSAQATVGAVHFNNLALTVEAGSGDVRLDGALTGVGRLVKTGAGAVVIVELAEWSGPTDILAGTVRTTAAGTLPTSGLVTLSPGTTLDLSMSAGGQTLGGLQGAGGALLMPPSAGIVVNQAVATAYNGSIHGLSPGGALALTGSGTLLLGGSLANDYPAITVVAGVSLQLGKPAGVASIGSGGLDVESGEARLVSDEQIPDADSVTVGAAGTFEMNGQSETIAELAGSGRVDLGNGTLTLGSSNSSLFSGTLAGTGPLVKVGPAALVLGGDSSLTYTGTIAVHGGTLLVDGSVSQATVAVTTGTLAGPGTVGTVVATGGQVAPGNGTGPGRLRIASGMTLGTAATLAVEIDGLGPGSDYGVVDVSGPASLGNATLSIAIGDTFKPPLGSTYTLIVKGGTDPISGIFAGHPEASTFVADGQAFVITYRGGDGNDVTLIAVPTPCALTPDDCGADAGAGDAGVGAGADAGDAGAPPPADAGAAAGDASSAADAGSEASPPAADAAPEVAPDASVPTPDAGAADRAVADAAPPGADASASDGGGDGSMDRVIADTGAADRVTADAAPSGADAGAGDGGAVTAADGAAADGATGAHGGGGCGCAVAATANGWSGALLLAGLVLLGRRRRRR